MSLRRREKENDGQETTFRFNETLVRSYSDTVCAVRPSSKRFGLDCMQQIRSARYIYIVSDSTGFTASHALTSVMAQFESVSVDWAGDSDVFNTSQLEVRTQMFSNVNDKVRLTRIVRLAATMKAFIVYTLMTPELNEQMVSYCYSLNVPCEDMLGPMVRNIAGFLGMHPSGEPRGSTNVKRKPLSDKYFSRIAAVEFTIRQDDGNLPSNLGKADVVLLGVSRSSKTPLSVYLAQQFGYRVANIPIIKDMPLPKELLEVDPRRVFGLTIAGPYLKRIRSRRLAETAGSFDYDNMKYINAELAWSKDLYSQHPEWSVIDVTGRSVEENAAIINELLGISTVSRWRPLVLVVTCMAGEADAGGGSATCA
ncbi:hypothetical protein GUITHDRAFT_85988 [Guillardia theta CCMP2712]|uniref:Uncharacterized protein n=1 Tax=Guillardia theta (strain CCMP2712) TaxID=905079 RepID=L1JK64_GUITC|nr:hypothetical protein GUITHDRAFT_85988 [Guillardia theta CCMP2712]EKX48913.1 hypothetical protein GUITHDRAFT_85988 [Guillardia theta CCMP2712]|eukprot:XP_005835893.1 hypothetical protein GUITHDRAFT_85988 [Guillardia theta CCMP2712]